MNYNGKNIDRTAQRVLHALKQTDEGRLNTSEIKNKTGIKKNYVLSHRYDVFEETGLVDRYKEQKRLKSGMLAEVTVIELSNAGWQFVEEHNLQTESAETLEEQLALLEADLRIVKQENEELKAFIRGLDSYLVEEAHVDVFDYSDDDVDRKDLTSLEDDFNW